MSLYKSINTNVIVSEHSHIPHHIVLCLRMREQWRLYFRNQKQKRQYYAINCILRHFAVGKIA